MACKRFLTISNVRVLPFEGICLTINNFFKHSFSFDIPFENMPAKPLPTSVLFNTGRAIRLQNSVSRQSSLGRFWVERLGFPYTFTVCLFPFPRAFLPFLVVVSRFTFCA